MGGAGSHWVYNPSPRLMRALPIGGHDLCERNVLTSVPQFLPGPSGQVSWTRKVLTNSGVFYSEQEAHGP